MHFDVLIASHLALPPERQVTDAESEDRYYRDHSGSFLPRIRETFAPFARLRQSPWLRHVIG